MAMRAAALRLPVKLVAALEASGQEGPTGGSPSASPPSSRRRSQAPLPQRWRMLAILSANICASYLPWYTFVPIMSQSMAVYGVLASDFNLLCILYSLVYVPGVFLSGKLLTSLGGHRCFVLATACLAGGCALRCGPAALGEVVSSFGLGGPAAVAQGSPGRTVVAASFHCLVAGQTLCAVGQTFLVNATSLLAAEWFPPSERPAASMISNLMNFVGGCLSFVVPTWFVMEGVSGDVAVAQVQALLLVQLKVALVALAITTLMYQDAPPSAKSAAQLRAVVPLFSEIWCVLSLRDFWLVNGQFLMYITVLNTFDAVEGALLVRYGYSEALASWTAVSFCASSILSTAIESLIITRPEHYRRAILGVNALLAVSCLLNLWCLWSGRSPGCFVFAVGIMGLSTPGWGCSMEIGSEVCYPAREATVSSLMEAFGALGSIIGIAWAQRLIDADCATMVFVLMAAGSLSGCLAMTALSGRLHRRDAEDAEEADEAEQEEACCEAAGAGPLDAARRALAVRATGRRRSRTGDLQCV